MALADRVTARRRGHATRSADPVTLEEFGALLGQATGRQVQSRAGVTVSTDRALGIPAWYRGARWLSETVSSLPLHTYRRQGALGRDRRADPLWTAPGPDTPWQALVEFLMMSLLHRGNAFCWKVRNPVGQVVGLMQIHPDLVRFGTAGNTKVFEIRQADGSRLAATTREVLHIPALSTDGYFGIDPIRAFANGLGTVAAADEYAARFYSNGANLGGYISMPGRLDQGDAERLKAQWQRLHQGVAHAHEFGVIGDGATYHTIGLDAEQTQMIETRKFGITDIARMLGVVPHKLYDLERATFSNIEHQAIEAVTDSIRPWCVRIEAYLNHDRSLVVARNFVEFQLEGLLRGDIKTRYEAYTAAVGGPWMEANVPRRLENLPARPELDVVLRPLNMGAAGAATDAEEAL